eukprot:8581042-Ditylum_brightwellii.AAC.1
MMDELPSDYNYLNLMDFTTKTYSNQVVLKEWPGGDNEKKLESKEGESKFLVMMINTLQDVKSKLLQSKGSSRDSNGSNFNEGKKK